MMLTIPPAGAGRIRALNITNLISNTNIADETKKQYYVIEIFFNRSHSISIGIFVIRDVH